MQILKDESRKFDSSRSRYAWFYVLSIVYFRPCHCVDSKTIQLKQKRLCLYVLKMKEKWRF